MQVGEGAPRTGGKVTPGGAGALVGEPRRSDLARAARVEIAMALGGGRSQLCSRGRHCGWEGAGSAAGAGLTLAERGGVAIK